MKRGWGLVMEKLGICTAAEQVSLMAVNEEKLRVVYLFLWRCDEGLLRSSESYLHGIRNRMDQHYHLNTELLSYHSAWKLMCLLAGLGTMFNILRSSHKAPRTFDCLTFSDGNDTNLT